MWIVLYKRLNDEGIVNRKNICLKANWSITCSQLQKGVNFFKYKSPIWRSKQLDKVSKFVWVNYRIWWGYLLKSSVADSGCLSRILIFTHPGSKNSNKREGWTKICCQNFLCSHKFHKIANYFSFEVLKKKIRANFQRIIELLTQKIVNQLSKIWFWDPGSEIRDPEKTYSGSRIPDPGVKKAPDLGSRIRNTVKKWKIHFFVKSVSCATVWLVPGTHCFGSGSSILGWKPNRIHGFDDQTLKRLPLRMSKLQKKLSALKREHPALQNIRLLNFFCFCGSVLPSRIRIPNPDTDPTDPLNWMKLDSMQVTNMVRCRTRT